MRGKNDGKRNNIFFLFRQESTRIEMSFYGAFKGGGEWTSERNAFQNLRAMTSKNNMKKRVIYSIFVLDCLMIHFLKEFLSFVVRITFFS